MNDRERGRPVLQAADQLPASTGTGGYSDAPQSGRGVLSSIPAALSELRRRWKLATLAFLLVLGPVLAYALVAVPQYTSRGVLQVSAQGGLASANPLMELASGGTSTQVNTEVQIITRRDFLASVFKGLRLHVVDPNEPRRVATDLSVSMAGQSPVDERLRRVRDALEQIEVAPELYNPLSLRLTMADATSYSVVVDPEGDEPRVHEGVVGELLELGDAKLLFAEAPMEPGKSFDVMLLGDGLLLDRLVPRLTVAALGTSREPTNLVRISFMHPDRHTARAVVQGIMDQYMVQSLNWQTQGASQSAGFVRERLQSVRADLSSKENALSTFAEAEHAVQLDTQARVTIENSAEIESARLQLDLRAQVLGSLAGRLRKSGRAGNADLTASMVDDPVLTGAIGALTEAETKHATLAATLTSDHPKLAELETKIKLQQKTVARLVKTARGNLGAKRAELDRRLAQTNEALASYPEKELQLARLMRDVEVSQRLYAFLLEKAQEAEILEASTTTDKRTVDNASLPHKRAAPNRTKLLATGAAFAMVFAFAAVYLARVFQRRVPTVEAARELVPYPTYGSIPLVSTAANSGADRLALGEVWSEGYSQVGEAFRALCVSLSLTPVREEGRGRIILMTSSFAGEGKSTVGANVAVSLARSGSKVLLIDLDLRRPVQHRIWKIRRSPGYADLMADASELDAAAAATECEKWGVDVIPAGTRLPDTLGAVLSPRLEGLLANAVSQYDYVVVDGAPMFVGDAPVLARQADLVLLVVRPGIVERHRLAESVAELSRMDAAKGVVFNGVSRSTSDYYYYSSDYRYAENPSSDDDAPAPSESSPANKKKRGGSKRRAAS